MCRTLGRSSTVALWSACHRQLDGVRSLARAEHTRISCLLLLVTLTGPLALGACEKSPAYVSATPTGNQQSLTPTGNQQPFFEPGPGRSRLAYDNDRIECSHDVRPWTIQGFTACMIAHGDQVFDWSSTKSPADLQQDRLTCARAVRDNLGDEQKYDDCLVAHGDLIPRGQQASSMTPIVDSSMAAFCMRSANGDATRYSGCMAIGRFRSQASCMSAANIEAGMPVRLTQKEMYVQCMAKEGYTVSAPPGHWAYIDNQGHLLPPSADLP
jgi:hypothetical protein